MKNLNRTFFLRNACLLTVAPLLSLPLSKSLAADEGVKVPLDLKLPSPAFKGTPKDIPLSSYVEPLSDKPRPAMMVPAGLKNLAKTAKLLCSDKNATSEVLAKLVDGNKEASDD